MTRLRDRITYDRDAPGVPVDDETRLELRRVAGLFLVSALTLALFLLRAVVLVLQVSSIPDAVAVVWGVALLTGWAMTYVYALYVTFQARRWGWLALCAVPLTSVPGAVAYSWLRRQEIERVVLGRGRPGRSRSHGGPDA